MKYSIEPVTLRIDVKPSMQFARKLFQRQLPDAHMYFYLKTLEGCLITWHANCNVVDPGQFSPPSFHKPVITSNRKDNWRTCHVHNMNLYDHDAIKFLLQTSGII